MTFEVESEGSKEDFEKAFKKIGSVVAVSRSQSPICGCVEPFLPRH